GLISRNLAQGTSAGAKALLISLALSARLKSCPVTKPWALGRCAFRSLFGPASLQKKKAGRFAGPLIRLLQTQTAAPTLSSTAVRAAAVGAIAVGAASPLPFKSGNATASTSSMRLA